MSFSAFVPSNADFVRNRVFPHLLLWHARKDGLALFLNRRRHLHHAFFKFAGGRLIRLFEFVYAKNRIAPKLPLWQVCRNSVRTCLLLIRPPAFVLFWFHTSGRLFVRPVLFLPDGKGGETPPNWRAYGLCGV